jgi:hypothetical protein
MSEIKITGKKKIKTIQKELDEQFPYLFIEFFTPDEWEKYKKGERMKPISKELTLVEARTKTPKESSSISIHGSTLVGNLESNFIEEYGLYAQICYANKEGKRYYTAGDMDKASLTKLNNYFEKKGYKKNPIIM